MELRPVGGVPVRRSFWFAFALALVAGAGAGARFGLKADAPAGPPGDTLVIAAAADVKDFLSVVQQSGHDADVLGNLATPVIDAEFQCKLDFRPGFARAWEFSDDGKTLRLTLRDDLTWQDGAPVTAEDLAFTFALAADPAVQSPKRTVVERMKEGRRPRVVDAHTVEFEFEEAYDRSAMLAHVGSLQLVPKHLLDGSAVARDALREHTLDVQAPISNGPWKVASWERGNQLVLEPNENYTGPAEERPKLGRVVVKVVPDYTERLAQLAAGTVDLVEGVDVPEADGLRSHPEIVLHRRGWRAMDYVAWNTLDPTDYAAKGAETPGQRPRDVEPHRLFGDREVRRALAMAIDTDKMIRELLTSQVTGAVYGRPAVGTITPALCDIRDDGVVRFPHDAGAAKARLAELGWTDTNNDGWIDKDGQNFTFTLITNASNPRRTRAATLLQADLAEAGIQVQVEQLDLGTFLARMQSRDFDAALSSWSASLFVNPATAWGEDSEYNFPSYVNPEATALLQKGLAEPDPERAAPIWTELQQVIYADQPYAFLYWADELVAIHERFQDTTVDLLGPWRHLNRWWVPDARVTRPVADADVPEDAPR